MEEFREGKRARMASRPQCFLEAKDLPRSDLSDFLEARMQRSMDEDRRKRAQMASCYWKRT